MFYSLTLRLKLIGRPLSEADGGSSKVEKRTLEVERSGIFTMADGEPTTELAEFAGHCKQAEDRAAGE